MSLILKNIAITVQKAEQRKEGVKREADRIYIERQAYEEIRNLVSEVKVSYGGERRTEERKENHV